jgi:hypothetical protein
MVLHDPPLERAATSMDTIVCVTERHGHPKALLTSRHGAIGEGEVDADGGVDTAGVAEVGMTGQY